MKSVIYLALYLALKRRQMIGNMVTKDSKDLSYFQENQNHPYTTIARHPESEHNETVACKWEKVNYAIYKNEATDMTLTVSTVFFFNVHK